MDPEDKLILIGGAGSRIGAATARSPARRGARLMAAEIDGSIALAATVVAQRPGSSWKR